MKLFSLVLLIILQNCTKPQTEAILTTRLLVESYTVTCQGFIEQQCYLVKEGDAIPDGEWSLFFESIDGFDYVPGFRYEIEVSKTERDPLVQDVGKYQYTFVSMISMEAVD